MKVRKKIILQSRGLGLAKHNKGGKQQHILNCATIFRFRNSPQCKLIAQRSVYQLYPWFREYATRAVYIY